jgi:hypothetical protein
VLKNTRCTKTKKKRRRVKRCNMCIGHQQENTCRSIIVRIQENQELSIYCTACMQAKNNVKRRKEKHRPNSYYTQRPVRRTSSPISLPILPIIPNHHTQSASKFPSQFRDGPNILFLTLARAHAFNVAEQPALPSSACAAVQLGCSAALEAESTGGTETRGFGDAAAAIAALLTHGAETIAHGAIGSTAA